jgi:ligand-binding SRPBCC domain-containing protein
VISAPIKRCFDLARSIEFHLHTAESERERAIGDVKSGLISEGEEVEWQATHFLLPFKMRVRITEFVPPSFFQDSMVKGPFQAFRHNHVFKWTGTETLMTDEIAIRCPFPRLVIEKVVGEHLARFIKRRNLLLKTALESNKWRDFLPASLSD